MNRPPPPHMMSNMYRGPRPFNNRWRPRGRHPPAGFQLTPNTYHRPPMNNTKENSEEHWCETCDRGFHTADLLDKHKQQHQKCNIDGCQFVAHPKVITKHIQMQHSSGLYKKIAKLDNPEEINKWREERKKKYPTRTNIEKKEAECKEKIERGEKMALKRDKKDSNNRTPNDKPLGYKRKHSFDRLSDQNRNNRQHPNQRQNQTPNNKNQPPAKKVPRVIPKVPSIVEKNKLKPFTGILSIDMDNNDQTEEDCKTLDCSNPLIEDDYYEKPIVGESPKVEPVQEPVVCGALTSLMCDYGTSDEEVDEKENKAFSNDKKFDCVGMTVHNNDIKDIENVNNDSVKKDTGTVNSNVIKQEEFINKDHFEKNMASQVNSKDNDENSDDDSPEEVKTMKSNDQEPNNSETNTLKNIKSSLPPKKINQIRHNQKQSNKYKHKIPSTLLYKLLHKEIRQERNIVLQCIRYIRKMNYFDKSSQ